MITTLRIRQNRAGRGSALVAVFWLIAVLGLIIFATIRFVSTDSGVVAGYKNTERARRMAEMGLAIGSHERVEKGDPALEFEDESGGGYRVALKKEESRLAINGLLKAGRKDVFRRLFILWGAGDELATVAADSLADWVDEDGDASVYGAESEWYAVAGLPGLPRNRKFHSTDEMLLVRGMDEVADLHPGWREAITLWGEGKLDINGAGTDVIAAVAGVPLGRAEVLVSVRSGYDGADGTVDDVPFGELAGVAQILGITPEAAGEIFSTEGGTGRVESVGRAGNAIQKLVLIKRGDEILWSGTETHTEDEANL